MNLTKIVNLLIRLGSIGSRFILIIFIGKYFNEYDIGVYGLFNSSIVLFYMFIGVDFYVYIARELVTRKEEEHFKYLGNQLYLYLIIYLLSIPFILYFLWLEFIPLEFALYFCLLLVLEHIGQELYRLFTAIGYPLFANWILFIRQGAWILLFILIAFVYNSFNKLENIFLLWIIGVTLANILALRKLFKIYNFNFFPKFDFDIIKGGLKLSSWFFASTLLYKFVEYSNRYFLDYYLGKEAVGVFVVLTQFSNLINVVVFTMVVMYLYPKLLKAGRDKNRNGFNNIKNELKIDVIKYSIGIAIILLLSIKPVLILLGKASLLNNTETFYQLVLANIFLNFSLIYHYALYSLGAVKSVFISSAIGAAFNILLNIVLIPFFGILGAGIATMLSFGFILLIKFYFFKKMSY